MEKISKIVSCLQKRNRDNVGAPKDLEYVRSVQKLRMERRILLTIILILLFETEAVCVDPDHHALGKLSVTFNRKIKHCPWKCVCNSTSSTVDCANSGLLEIPTQASALRNAHLLSLDYNEIKEIRSAVFSNMKDLVYLDLNRNRIRTIESGAFEGLTSLLWLHLGENLIKHIPTNVFNGADVPNLAIIEMKDNELESIEIETFSDMTQLEAIDLSNNRISHISHDAFKGLTKLSSLDLSNNSITSVAWVIGNTNSFQNLEVLEIHANCLKTLPTNILDSLPRLIHMELEPNPWRCDRNLKLVYDAWMVADIYKASWSCENPWNLSQTIKVADLSNDTLEMFTLSVEDTTRASQTTPKIIPIQDGWSSENPLNLSQTRKVTDLRNDTSDLPTTQTSMMKMSTSAVEDQNDPTNDRAKIEQSQASPAFGHSHSPMVIIGFCTSVLFSSSGPLLV
ncbi:variable lymphocyte receptor [Plakobranchus ocellatus]|uniref:Variable lymphocyte receptor n=1 Tax=Plakobranchus ocellatus TaxID=259542 RepID=A0AAV3ZB10_9GAST|nr:variable lymphocyte receptor [Plakobranchus ocellatus]